MKLSMVGGWLAALPPWRARSVALAAGALSALGFAPLDAFPFLLLGYTALVLLLDGAQGWRHACWIGWSFGFGQFLIGLHWVGYAFLVDPSQHAWQIPFVAILFPGGLALFFALAAATASLFWRPGISRIFVLSAALAVTEWLRGHVLTGFPWNIAGYSWGASLSMMQGAALFGVYGLSLLTMMLGASLAELFTVNGARRLPVAMLLFFAALFVGGWERLSQKTDPDIAGVRLRIVQPNIAQADKYKPSLIDRNWNRLIQLSTRPAAEMPTHILWPEAGPPFLLQRSDAALRQIAALTAQDRVLMTGAVRVSHDDGARQFYNSFFVFGRGGQLLGLYDKFHLVPLGEYLPFEKMLSALGLKKLVGIAGSFSTGDGPHTLFIRRAPPASVLICYEILFPDQVVADQRARWIVNVTDDSWFGPWAGPSQHLMVARMRAIEQGIPVVRAANTGISAVIDAKGRIRARLDLALEGVIDSGLPASIAPTPFARQGEYAFWLLVLAALLAGLLVVQNRQPQDEDR
ncbi:MAG: apolipoprotein N-acyltransferase [Alphaproteobacteria bacterium]|nr:apolipoprotein N-acyltransferase [Alphaproteobacteria bacterium]MBV9693667.1 apolipoprotein N-acyltransferase [Alphaproteobacteria bacterium]